MRIYSARTWLAIAAAQILRFFLRLLGRGATTLPGKVALLMDRRLLARLTAKQRVFLVTGTNGKTTTVRILCTLLEANGYEIITNPSGANLGSGLATTLINHRKLLRRRSPDDLLALVFEIDEAYFAKLAPMLNPQISVVTNLFRDQLDRFGDLQHTRDLIDKGLDSNQGKIILCADDYLCASLAVGRENRVLFFGIADEGLQSAPEGDMREAALCTFCGEKYHYDGVVYGHLGRFSCPRCGFSRPRPDLLFTAADLDGRTLGLELSWQGETAATTLPIPGIHNGYNAAAALATVLAAGLPFDRLVAALQETQAAFGRMERFEVGDREVCMILVKNPVGMDLALDFVASATDRGGIMFLLNANDSDGRDVSWIREVNFEKYLPPGLIGISGERCRDMALRLCDAGKRSEDLLVDPDHVRLFDRLLTSCPAGQCLYILPNYTAMLSLRAELARRYQLREFWR